MQSKLIRASFVLVFALFAAGGVTLSLKSSEAAPTPETSVATDAATPVPMGSCCRVVVKGCSKEAKVCVAGGCSLDAQKKARNAFEKAYSCRSTSVSSYIGTCSGEKCAIDLR